MVRDILIDIAEKDLLLANKRDETEPCFDVLWGNIFNSDKTTNYLICNILVPRAYWDIVKYDENLTFVCHFLSPYKPESKPFRLRLVKADRVDGEPVFERFDDTVMRGKFGLSVNSYAFNKNIAEPIHASQLPFIDMDGEYLAKFVKNKQEEGLDRAYVYSSKVTDFNIGFSDDQSGQLLGLCAPGKSYRYPTTGVGITSYLNGVIAHSDLADKLMEQFEGDQKIIQDASFDATTGVLNMQFNPEAETADTSLMDIDALDHTLLTDYTDEFVKRNTVITEMDDLDYISLLADYQDFLDIVMFQDENTHVTLLADNIEEGKRFNEYGTPINNSAYCLVSATVEANTIIMFDDEMENHMDNMPVFTINDTDQTKLYKHLIGQPMYISEKCHKCAVIMKRSTIKYVVAKEDFENGKGIFIVPQISENIKNMLTIASDHVTGKLMGIVSKNTSISDVSLNEITSQIFATKSNN